MPRLLSRLAAMVAGLAPFLVPQFAPSAQAADRGAVIALSNAYYGNAWRHQMAASFEETAKRAKQAGLIRDYIVLNGDNTVSQQMQQMSSLILKHVSAIAIDAASLTALNGVIQKACAAGIYVIAFDSIASAPCATTLNWDFASWQAHQVSWIADAIGRQGNVLIVRGVKGSAPDEENYKRQMEMLAKYPKMKVVATVYGMATGAVAQTAVAGVLPSLPHIDAVLAQGGGEDYGIAQAFEQYGDTYRNKLPVIGGGGSADFIHWWSEQRARNGYSTISMNSPPSIGSAAFWIALDALQGVKVSKQLFMPFTTVTNETLSKYQDMKPGTIVSPAYDEAWVKANLLQAAGR